MRDPSHRVGRQPECQRSGDQRRNGSWARKYHPDNYVNNPLADLAEEKMKRKSTRHTRPSRSKQRGGGGYQQQSSGYYQGGYQQQQQRQYGGGTPPSPGCGTSSTWGT